MMDHEPPGPTLTCAQVRELDRLAIEHLAMPGIILMENAGRNAAEVALAELARGAGRGAVVLAGAGNNGGDGYVIARHLHNRGAAVRIVALKAPSELTGDAAINAEICRRMGLGIVVVEQAGRLPSLEGAALVVDALLGTGFRGQVREPIAGAIERINEAGAGGARVLAVDVPSGLDCQSGRPSNATVRADVTVTFAAYKSIFDEPGAAEFAGRVVVADIGVPPGLLEMVRGGGG